MNHRTFHKTWANIARDYGPVVRLALPGMGNLVLLTNPDDCELVIRSTMDNPVRPGFDSLRKIRHEAPDDYFEQKADLLPEYVCTN